jgi:hypothetical protein
MLAALAASIKVHREGEEEGGKTRPAVDDADRDFKAALERALQEPSTETNLALARATVLKQYAREADGQSFEKERKAVHQTTRAIVWLLVALNADDHLVRELSSRLGADAELLVAYEGIPARQSEGGPR